MSGIALVYVFRVFTHLSLQCTHHHSELHYSVRAYNKMSLIYFLVVTMYTHGQHLCCMSLATLICCQTLSRLRLQHTLGYTLTDLLWIPHDGPV